MEASFFQSILRAIGERGRELLTRSWPSPGQHGSLLTLSDALLSGRGEASGVALAREILTRYTAALQQERGEFVGALANGFGPDLDRLDRAAGRYLENRSSKAMSELAGAVESRRLELIKRLNLAPGGTQFLVGLREDVQSRLATDPALEPLETDLASLFSSWFNRGFLVLRRIDWTTPANVLEKIMKYEAVHTITSWDDLRNRLTPADRRCYAFFHPQLVDDPLIFVEVALTRKIPGAIHPLLKITREPLPAEEATTAVFYSISNCQAGLKGISFGNFLIKQVVEEMKRDLPSLRTFVTLSPTLGFRKWLTEECANSKSELVDDSTREVVQQMAETGWKGFADDDIRARDAVMLAAAAYFLLARTADGKLHDPVARFHLGNGAQLERINWNGDCSDKGLREGAGLMVNYLYDLPAIERNHEAFANGGEVVVGSSVAKVLEKKRRFIGAKRTSRVRKIEH